MKINKFKKIGTNKFKIYFDNDFIVVYDETIIKYNLLYKKEIDDDLLKEVIKFNIKMSIYDVALKYIKVRMRSIKEMRDYLINKKFDISDVDNTINRLINNSFLNDNIFAKSYINDKLNFTNTGPLKLKIELEKYGVDESIITSCLDNIDNNLLYEKLTNLINKDVKNNSKYPVNKLKNKIINKYINLGYSLEDITDILSNINIVSKSDIKSEYSKLITKYSKKYTGSKLEVVLKNKLYQKGYTKEEIYSIFPN